MPYQVALEVTRNVASVRSSLPDSYDALRKQVDGLRKAPADRFTGSRHLHAERIAKLKAVLDENLDRALTELAQIRDADEAVVDAERDSVMRALDDLYAGRVLPEPAPATVRRRVERFGDHRAPNEVPPGWRDAVTSSVRGARRHSGSWPPTASWPLRPGPRASPTPWSRSQLPGRHPSC